MGKCVLTIIVEVYADAQEEGIRQIISTREVPDGEGVLTIMEAHWKRLERGEGITMRTADNVWITIPPSLIAGPIEFQVADIETK